MPKILEHGYPIPFNLDKAITLNQLPLIADRYLAL